MTLQEIAVVERYEFAFRQAQDEQDTPYDFAFGHRMLQWLDTPAGHNALLRALESETM